MNFDLNEILNNEYVLIAMTLFVVLYGSMSQMDIPAWLKALFKNDVFRVVFLSLLLIYRFDKAPHVALIVALVFIFSLNYVMVDEAKEHFAVMSAMNENMNDNMLD